MQRRKGAKVLKIFVAGFGRHGFMNAISGPALVNLDFSTLRLGGFAPFASNSGYMDAD
jgi:hypothetical protein